jgi:hypothetical protein
VRSDGVKVFLSGTKPQLKMLILHFHLLCQFHQHFKNSFFVQRSFFQLFTNYSLAVYFFQKNVGTKGACKMLVKLISSRLISLFFINREIMVNRDFNYKLNVMPI